MSESYRPPWLDPSRIKAQVARTLQVRESKAGLALCEADAVFRECGPGGHVFAVTKGQFSMIDLIRAALGVVPAARVSIWTWCVADYELFDLSELFADGRIIECRMVVDRAGVMRQRHFLAWFLQRFGPDSVRVTWSHAKIATISGGNLRYVIRGSLNLNANPRLEQIDITEGGEAADMMAEIEAELWAAIPPPDEDELIWGRISDKFQEAFGSASIR